MVAGRAPQTPYSIDDLISKVLKDKKYIPDEHSKPGVVISAAAKYVAECEPGALNSIASSMRLKVAAVQCYCREKGHDPGKIDGYNGPQTHYAIRELLKLNTYFKDWDIESKPIWPFERDVEAFYGEKGKNQVKVQVPYPLLIAWNNNQDIDSITLHQKVADSALRALHKIYDHYGIEKIKLFGLNQFGGSLNVRLKRGSQTQWSMHSWGIAIDWYPQQNQLKWGMNRASLARTEIIPFWEIWEEEGWVSLGRKRNYDWMHVQAARLI